MALPCEIGMYFDFNVTEDGIPYGCEGLDQFTSENFNKSKNNFTLVSQISMQGGILTRNK